MINTDQHWEVTTIGTVERLSNEELDEKFAAGWQFAGTRKQLSNKTGQPFLVYLFKRPAREKARQDT
jgi:hypothetical protein